MSKDSLAKYYQNNKENYKKKAHRRKKRSYDCEQCKNLPEEEDQKLLEYRKNIKK